MKYLWKNKTLVALLFVLVLLVGGATDNPKSRALDKYNSFVRSSVEGMLSEHVFIKCFDSEGRATNGGSGVVIDAEKGLIVTANHVIHPKRIGKNAAYVHIYTTTGKRYWANIYTNSAKYDVAIIRCSFKLATKSAVFAKKAPFTGQDIYVLGVPESDRLIGTVTKGVISSKRRLSNNVPGAFMYQTDALISHGSSGGGWYTIKGELIAITSQGLGFTGNISKGVPVKYIKLVLEGIK